MWINEIQFQSLRSFCILYKITIHTCNCDISIVNYCYSIKKSFNIFKPSLKKIVWFVTFLWRETFSFTMKQPHTDQGKVTPSFFLSCFLSYKPQPESLPLPVTAFPQFSKFAHLYQQCPSYFTRLHTDITLGASFSQMVKEGLTVSFSKVQNQCTVPQEDRPLALP